MCMLVWYSWLQLFVNFLPPAKEISLLCLWFSESPRESSGGISYNVILKPATNDGQPRPVSPPKDKPLTQEDIDEKLKLAEERRQVIR